MLGDVALTLGVEPIWSGPIGTVLHDIDTGSSIDKQLNPARSSLNDISRTGPTTNSINIIPLKMTHERIGASDSVMHAA